jgi:hypothetical protein
MASSESEKYQNTPVTFLGRYARERKSIVINLRRKVPQPQPQPQLKLCECGCAQPAPIAKRNHSNRPWIVKGQPARFVAGHFIPKKSLPLRTGNKDALRHGMSHSREYNSYRGAIQRCRNSRNPRWMDYGGRGIKFLFSSFEHFFAELGPRPAGMTLDRIETNGNYEPGNVRWATPRVQRWNQRLAHAC